MADVTHLAGGGGVDEGIDHGDEQMVGVEAEAGDEEPGKDALPKVKLFAEGAAKTYDEGFLPCAGITLAVAIVVDYEKGVNHKGNGGGEEEDFPIEMASEDEVGAARGHVAEEEIDEEITHAVVRTEEGVEKGTGKDDSHDGDDHPGLDVLHKGEADGGGEEADGGDAKTHGAGGDPTLGTGSLRTKALFIVSAAKEVVEIVDEVGEDLHQTGKKGAEQRGFPIERLVGGTEVHHGESARAEHADEGAGEGFGAARKVPGL